MYFVEADFPGDGGCGRYHDMSECGLTVEGFSKSLYAHSFGTIFR